MDVAGHAYPVTNSTFEDTFGPMTDRPIGQLHPAEIAYPAVLPAKEATATPNAAAPRQPEGKAKGAGFLSYVHSLRGLSIIAVIASHVAELSGWDRGPSPLQRTLRTLFSNGTVPFVFVSGFLFQHLMPRFRYALYLRRRLATVILPYLVVSVPTLLLQYVRGNGIYAGAEHASPIVVALRACLVGAQMPLPLWYIPMIALFFLAAPILQVLERRRWLVATIIPSLLVAVFLHRSREHRLVFQSAAYFLPIYLAGMWASTRREAMLAFVDRYGRTLLAITVAAFVVEIVLQGRTGPIYSRHPFSTEAGVLDLDLPIKLLLSFLVLALLRRYDTSVSWAFAGLADASFGLFFLHGYVLLAGAAALRRGSARPIHLGVGGFALALTGVVLVSMGGVRVVQRCLGRASRYAIGC
ncbi:MAG TPA: acyltransferase [Polyangia bacterium]|nr:acyltransferase [Polyangia bacterium]